jgi:MoaA/NifB/PqqE/SkfB family radical SAM enzyme
MKKTAGIQFLKNYVHNRVSSSVKHPTYAYITITSLCDSHCNYCDAWKNKSKDELTTEQWKGIIDELAEVGIVTLTFSGGEPFLRKDLFELASYARFHGLITMVVTNLSLFKPDHIEKIAESFDFFGVSIDSPRPEIYEEIRGVDWLPQIKQNVGVIMAGLSELNADTQVCGMVTISNRNADELHETIHMIFDELQMDTISFNLVDTNGGAHANQFVPTQEQIDTARNVILDHKSVYPISNSKRYIDQLGNFVYRCNPWKCIQINDKGSLIVPCLFFTVKPNMFPGGRELDLGKNKLSDVIQSKNVQELYSQYENCKECNLGCVAEAAWSTYDLKFILADSFLGIILPNMKRVESRNKGLLKKPTCSLE